MGNVTEEQKLTNMYMLTIQTGMRTDYDMYMRGDDI